MSAASVILTRFRRRSATGSVAFGFSAVASYTVHGTDELVNATWPAPAP